MRSQCGMEKFFLVSTVFFALVAGFADYCPDKCSCSSGIDSNLVIDCSAAGLASIPSTPNWTTTLILKGNLLTHFDFDSISADLRTLNLANNALEEIEIEHNHKLEVLDVSNNRLKSIAFVAKFPQLRSLDVKGNNIKTLGSQIFPSLPFLEKLALDSNPIQFIQTDLFSSNSHLVQLSLSNTSLTLLPSQSLHQLLSLKLLDISQNPLNCDCRSVWFLSWRGKENQVTLLNFESTHCENGEPFLASLQALDCGPVLLDDSTYFVEARLGDSVTLACNTSIDAEVNWISPSGELVNSSDPTTTVLPTGQLVITSVNRHSVGLYSCLSYDTESNTTASFKVQVSTMPLRRVQINSLYVGAACCCIFIVITALVQGFRYLMDFMGWWECCYCCGKRLSPRAKQIRRFLEDVEQYKSVHLDKLRDNYQLQVLKIRENCTQQIERLHDSYQNQVKYLRGVRDSGTQHLTTLREQYADQARKVYDYSCERVARVRRNYVTQRARIRKFSVHQLIRLRETYKFQQKTLNKIIENIPSLYLDNCRNAACARTQSIYFDDEPDVDIVSSIMKQSINIALPDDIDEEVSGTPPDTKTPLEQTSATEDTRNRKRGHIRQASAGSLDFSAFFPPIRFPSRISWRRRNPETALQVSVAVEICPSSNVEDENDINIADDKEQDEENNLA